MDFFLPTAVETRMGNDFTVTPSRIIRLVPKASARAACGGVHASPMRSMTLLHSSRPDIFQCPITLAALEGADGLGCTRDMTLAKRILRLRQRDINLYAHLIQIQFKSEAKAGPSKDRKVHPHMMM